MTRTRPASLRRSLALSTALGVSLGIAVPVRAQDTPSGPSIASGALSVTFTTGNNPVPVAPSLIDGGAKTLNVSINQPKAIINWQKFDISGQGTVNFTTLTSGASAVLNRVGSADVSQIAGNLKAPSNLAVWIINPNGIMVGPNARINVGSLVATTLNTTDAEFAGNGAIGLKGTTGSIATSVGSIITTTAVGGVLAFIAPVVQVNGGTFAAGNTGSAAFVVASDVTISQPGSPLSLVVNAGTPVGAGALDLGGTVTAGNAYAVVSAQTAVNALLNISAAVTTASASNGVVVLAGDNGAAAVGPVSVAAGMATGGGVTLAATGALTAGGGGQVRVLGRDAITVSGALTTAGGGDVTVSNYTPGSTAIVSVQGNVTSSGDYTLSGGVVALGNGAVPQGASTQSARGDLSVTARDGTISGLSAVRLIADADGSGDAMRLNASAGFALAPTLLISGNPAGKAQSAVDFTTSGDAQPFVLGGVRAGALTHDGGIAGLSRTAAVTTGDLFLAGGTSIVTTDKLVTGAVAAGGDLTLRGNAGVVVNGTLDGTGALVVQADPAGGVTLNGAVGGTTPFGSFTSVGAGPVRLNAGAVRTTGAQDYGGQLILGADAVLTGTGASFAGGVSGAGDGTDHDLALNFTGATTLAGGAFTGIRNLATDTVGAASGGTTLSGAITTSGSQVFNDAVTLDGATTLTSTGAANDGNSHAVTFARTVDGGDLLTVATPGVLTFGGTVGGTTALGGIAAASAVGVRIQGAGVTTGGGQAYGATVLNGSSTGPVTLKAGGDIGFVALDGPRGLFVASPGVTALTGGNGTPLASIATDGAGTTALSGTIVTAGSQTYLSAVVLGGATTLRSIGAAPITLNALSGNGALVTATGGITTFNAGVGGIASLTTQAGGTTVLNGTMLTAGAQSYGNDVRLGSDTAVTSSGGGALSFAGTVTGAHALTLASAGLTIFGGRVGRLGGNGLADAALSPTALTNNGPGALRIDGGAVITSGAQSYGSPVQLGLDTVLTGTAGQLNGGVVGNGYDLTLNFSGPTVVDGQLFSGVKSFTSGGGGTTALSGTIETGGAQVYLDDVLLVGDAALRSTGGNGVSGIRFGGSLDGGQALSITTGGPTVFTGTVGGTTPLRSLLVAGGGTAALNGGAVTTVETQSYADAAVLGADTLLTSSGGDVMFGGPVNGPYQLSVRAVAGSASFGAPLGGTTALTGLAIRARAATAAAGNRVGALAAAIDQGGFGFDSLGALTVGTVDGLSGVAVPGGAATLSAGGLLTLNAPVTAGAVSLTGTGITQGAGAPVDAGGGTILLDGNDGAVVLAASLATTDTGASAVRIVDATTVQLGAVATGSGGTLTLGGAGGDFISGAVTQGMGSILAAGTVAGSVGGGVTLNNAGNAIGTLGAFAANGLALRTGNALTVTGPVDAGTGGLTLRLDAGDLTLNGDLLVPSGAVTLNAAGAIAQAAGRIVAQSLTGSAGGTVSLLNPSNSFGSLSGFGAGGLALVNDRALVLTGDIVSSNTLQLTAPGIDFTGRTLSAVGSVTLNGLAGAIKGETASAGASLTMTGASLALGAAKAGAALSLRATDGNLSLTTGIAGGDAVLSARGGVSLGTLGTAASLVGGAVTIAAETGDVTGGGVVAAGAAAVTAANAIRLSGLNGGTVAGTGRSVEIGSSASRSTLVLTASGGGLSLGTGTATGAATLTATGPVTVTASLGAGDGIGITSGGNLSLANGQTGGNASFDANGTATLGSVTAGSAAAITVKALDAAIGGTLRAGSVTFANRAPATTALRLGNGTAAGGFTLDTTEVNNVEAARLTFDGGSGDVQIGTLPIDGDAGRARFDVLTTGHIDVTGTVSGTGAGRAFRLGGTAASTGDQASAIRVVATADAGGRLLFDTADLDLRGARIGVGQAGGLLDPLGLAGHSGLPVSAVVGNYVGNPNSALYNAAFGGTRYPAGTTLLSANSLTVRYTEFALFQNTGEPGRTSGVALGTAAAGPQPGALVIQGPANAVDAFALFGTIGGIGGEAAALLPPAVVTVNGADVPNARINGCAVGSAAGCLAAVVTQPLLGVFDTNRADVIRVEGDLVVPFDPAVGTSNEALFAGLGQVDEPVTATGCAADAVSAACQLPLERR